ncbi:MAG: calcium-binding protein [Methylococcaceae bacterium]|nr:MAG: calcium-binding protein [Methylococcaceae bacterium]
MDATGRYIWSATKAAYRSRTSCKVVKDKLQGKDGADRLYGGYDQDDLSGGWGNDRLYGGYDDDFLYGEAGNDQLFGEQDDDHLEGGVGSDTLDGGLGKDTMIGGAGNDVYYLGYDAADVITDQGLPGDVDTVVMPYQLAKYTLPGGIENGAIAEGTQNSSLSGNNGDNTLTGNDGDNGLNGGVGHDSLFGGAGADTLTGGSGADRFDFNVVADSSGGVMDVVRDFNRNDGDKIDLAGIDANIARPGDQSFTLLDGGAFTSAGQLHFDAAAHVLYGSNDNDGAVEFAIQLNGITGLSAASLIL